MAIEDKSDGERRQFDQADVPAIPMQARWRLGV
jgi:hypothetical protein